MDEVASLIRRVWHDTLPEATGEASENFFAAGGTSLGAAMFVASLRELGVEVPLTAVFENGQLGAIIAQATMDAS